MTNHSQRAMELFKQGYNCAQSVVAAFYEEIGVDFKMALKMSSSFGAGIGRLREVCGAVSGMAMVIGMKYGYTEAEDYESKTELYKMIQETAEKFKAEKSFIICRELLGLKEGTDSPIPEIRTEEYYNERPCMALVGYAAGLLDRLIENKDKIEERQ